MAIQFKRGTAARLYELNPVIAEGEPIFEYDTGKLKIGDGVHLNYNDLPYYSGVEEISSFDTFEELPEQGNANLLYRVTNEKNLYQWNQSEMSYEPLNGGGSDTDTIKIINGGNANG